MTLRVAIYARYSSDSQREASIDDQIRVCRAHAERKGWTVVHVYADYAISGASADRPRFQQLQADFRAGRFEVILAEALDRISRDQEHIAGFYKRANFAGLRVVTIAEGDIAEMHVGVTGTMAALFLKDLAQNTHRGLEGRVRAGHSGGGLSFGYRVLRGVRPDGMLITGELETVPEEAAIVRRVFEDYVGGQSPRAIAKTLNAERIVGARGGRWTASLILGNAARETGLLRNRLYAGERAWNRQRFIKDPSTGKRVARPNPSEAWVITPAPELRIIDAPLWEAAQVRLQAGRRLVVPGQDPIAVGDGGLPPNTGARLAAARRAPWLLSGLVRCGLCGGPMSVMGSNGRLGCANHVERGTCTNRRTLLRDTLLRRVLIGLKERLLAPELVEEFVRTYVAEVNAANRDRGARRARLMQEHGKLARQIRNLLELIKDGHGSPAMVQELRGIEQRQDALAAETAETGTPEAMPDLHPNLPALYRRKLEALEEPLRDPATAMAATEALRGLVDAILIHPGEKRGEVSVQLRGDLASFLYLGEATSDTPPGGGADSKAAVLRAGNGRSREVLGTLVAGNRSHHDLRRIEALAAQVNVVAGDRDRHDSLFRGAA